MEDQVHYTTSDEMPGLTFTSFRTNDDGNVTLASSTDTSQEQFHVEHSVFGMNNGIGGLTHLYEHI